MTETLGERRAAIAALIDAPGAWQRRALAPFLLGLLMLFDSWDAVMIAFVMPALAQQWHLEPVSMGWLMSSGYAGQFLGAFSLGSLAERFGRRPVYTAAVAAMCALSLACATATSPEMLALLRFLQGVAIGGAVPVCASYINEIAPTATRGRFFSIFQFLMVSGYGAAAIASSLIVEQFGWRIMFVLGAVPLLLLPFAFALLPESPRWLARVGRFGDALAAIRRLGGPSGSAVSAATPSGGEQEQAERFSFAALLAPDVRRTVGVLAALWFLTSLVNYGLTNWVPSIYVSEFKLPMSTALQFSSIAILFVLFVPMLLGALMDRIGRRPLAIAGTLAGGVVLSCLLLVGQNVPLVVAMVALGHTGIGIGTIILWPYSAEAFPTRVRAMALGLCSSLARGASMLTPLLVGGLLAWTGSVEPVFAVFGALGLIVAAIWIFGTRETKGVDSDTGSLAA